HVDRACGNRFRARLTRALGRRAARHDLWRSHGDDGDHPAKPARSCGYPPDHDYVPRTRRRIERDAPVRRDAAAAESSAEYRLGEPDDDPRWLRRYASRRYRHELHPVIERGCWRAAGADTIRLVDATQRDHRVIVPVRGGDLVDRRGESATGRRS